MARAGAVYGEIAKLALKLRLGPQTHYQAILQYRRVPGDESVILPNRAVFDQYAGHMESTRGLEQISLTRGSIAPIVTATAERSQSSF